MVRNLILISACLAGPCSEANSRRNLCGQILGGMEFPTVKLTMAGFDDAGKSCRQDWTPYLGQEVSIVLSTRRAPKQEFVAGITDLPRLRSDLSLVDTDGQTARALCQLLAKARLEKRQFATWAGLFVVDEPDVLSLRVGEPVDAENGGRQPLADEYNRLASGKPSAWVALLVGTAHANQPPMPQTITAINKVFRSLDFPPGIGDPVQLLQIAPRGDTDDSVIFQFVPYRNFIAPTP